MLLEVGLAIAGILVVGKLLGIGKKAYAFNSLMVTLSAVNNWKVSLTKITFDVKLRLFNPTKEVLTVNWIYLDAYLETAYFTNINYTEEITIQPEKENIVIIPVKINMIDTASLMATTLGEYLKQGKKPSKLRLDGYVKTLGYQVPVDTKIDVI